MQARRAQVYAGRHGTADRTTEESDIMELHSSPIFKHLTQEQLEQFVASCHRQEMSAGAEVMARGDHGEYVLLLLEGELSVRLDGMRRDKELARLQPPAVVGEMQMLTGEPRSASVISTTPVVFLAISIDVIQKGMEDGDPATLKIVANIARVLAHRLAALTEKVLELEAFVPSERSAELQQFRSQLFSDWSS